MLFILFYCFTLVAQDFSSLFNDKISNEDLQKLANGETVIRNIGSIKKLSLTNSNNTLVQNIHKELNQRKPNYLAEIIKIVPKTGNEDLLSKIYSGILDIESYTQIPYYSVRQKQWYDLYDYVEINRLTGTDDNLTMDFTVEMTPFGIINLIGLLEKTDNSLFFYMINNNKIIYEYMNIKCVDPKKMYSSIALFEYNNYYVLYGVGCLNAPSIFFLKDRIDTAFIGRINAFCTYMFDQISLN